MEKQFKQVIQGIVAMLVMAMTLLSVIAFRFVIYAPNTWNLVLQRIGG